jgi:hypothetical protein
MGIDKDEPTKAQFRFGDVLQVRTIASTNNYDGKASADLEGTRTGPPCSIGINVDHIKPFLDHDTVTVGVSEQGAIRIAGDGFVFLTSSLAGTYTKEESP